MEVEDHVLGLLDNQQHHKDQRTVGENLTVRVMEVEVERGETIYYIEINARF